MMKFSFKLTEKNNETNKNNKNNKKWKNKKKVESG